MIYRVIRAKVALQGCRRTFHKVSAEDGAAVREMAAKQAVLENGVRKYKASVVFGSSIVAGGLIAYPFHLHTVEVGMKQLERTLESQNKVLKALSKAVDMVESQKNQIKALTEELEAAKKESAELKAQLEEQKATKPGFIGRIYGRLGGGKN